ncbi:MAG: hypothetical protein HRU19_22170 [Pseudobacteriovorax sp.]|nr:hypothetical protein [Pseudobacteriovorax sp.]
MKHLALITCLPILTIACGTDNDTESEGGSASSNTISQLAIDEFLVDSTSEADWVFIDLDEQANEVDSTSPWDIAIQRYRVKLNTGANAETTAAVIDLSHDDVVEIPTADVFTTDQVTTNIDDGLVFLGDSPWYDYDSSTHILRSKEQRSYIVKSNNGVDFVVSVVDYYDDVGTPGFMKFKIKSL